MAIKIKEKQVRVITIVLGIVTTLLIGVLGFKLLEGSLTRAEDITPKNVAITEIQQNSVRVKWNTDRETQSVIEYGNTPTSLTFFAPESVKTKEHSVELNLLTAGTTYYFQIRTGDKKFDNGGVPWTFTTLAKDQTTFSSQTSPSPTSSTASPSQTATPTLSSQQKDSSCSLSAYKNYFGQKNPVYDQDENGIINFRDWSVCYATNGKLAPSSTPSPSSSPSATPTPTN